ncbi:MAG TPA: thiamine pyrophosphate-requiring protein [Steroidobacteraceae bacterium]|jgi:acetolactate synthase-1/2/3 large subunit|nr:thiamine pyrophosphate-requiring protein [Steroidobacteraceae bacterium]
MNVAQAAAEIFKREGVEFLLAYPLNPLTESCAAAGIRPIIVRQERVGLHMADAISRMTSGEKVGVFACQAGPGVENAFGAVAQAWSEGVPLIFMPGAASRNQAWIRPGFNATLNFQHIVKQAEQINTPEMLVPALRRAFSMARNGRPGPVLIEVPGDMWNQEIKGEIDYKPTRRILSAPSAADVDAAAAKLIAAKRPLIYAGQGIHYAKAWPELKAVAELLESPVTTSLEGKSAFPETHALSLGSGGVAMPKAVFQHVQEADVIFGAGASFTATGFGIRFPTNSDKTFIHNTLDPMDVNKNIHTDYPLVGDSKLTLEMLHAAVKERIKKPRGLTADVHKRIREQNDPWMAEWNPRLTSESKPLSPYRVIWDLMQVADVANTIITHDAGSPRDELSPFWRSVTPLSYIGWGKSTQLGYGIGLAMGAKLAHPDKLCINMWGDAAIGMTGMDFETAVRNNIPILSILFNNYAMAMEFKVMAVSRAKYHSTDISGNYADWAKALGGYSERVTEPDQVVHALLKGIAATKEGKPALLEFITTQDKVYSTFEYGYQG